MDPFSRRLTRPMSYWSTNRRQEAGEGDEKGDEQKAPEPPGGAPEEEEDQACPATFKDESQIEVKMPLSSFGISCVGVKIF